MDTPRDVVQQQIAELHDDWRSSRAPRADFPFYTPRFSLIWRRRRPILLLRIA